MRSFLLTVLVAFPLLIQASVDLDDQIACGAKIKRQWSRLRSFRPNPATAAMLEHRAAIIDARFAKLFRARYFRTAKGYIATDLSARGQATSMKLLVDRDLIVLGYEVKRSGIKTFHCSDLLP